MMYAPKLIQKLVVTIVFFVVLSTIIVADERKLKVNDEIQLTVFGESELGAVTKIDSSGSINFPLVGNVEASGKTASEVAAVVEERLEQDYIRDAHVTVSVVEEFKEKPKPAVISRSPTTVKKKKQSVTILGEVRSPGTVEFEEKEIEILTALAKVGGLSQLANTKRVSVKRMLANGATRNYQINVSDLQTGTGRFVLYPNDIVSIPKRIF